jgi:hypothetical protein
VAHPTADVAAHQEMAARDHATGDDDRLVDPNPLQGAQARAQDDLIGAPARAGEANRGDLTRDLHSAALGPWQVRLEHRALAQVAIAQVVEAGAEQIAVIGQ